MGPCLRSAPDIMALRKSLKFTQQEFAQLFGVHHMTASKWERGS